MPSCAKFRREMERHVKQLAEPAGYTVTITHPKSVTAHYRLTLEGPGGRRSTHFPGTPKNDGDQRNYLRQWVRRTIEELRNGG